LLFSDFTCTHFQQDKQVQQVNNRHWLFHIEQQQVSNVNIVYGP